MRVGFVKPSFPGEKRVGILPQDVPTFLSENMDDKFFIEEGYGKTVDVSDQEYRDAGLTVLPRDGIFCHCDGIHSLKLLQPSDYHLLRDNQVIIGWTHPFGSGADFFRGVASDKNLVIVDTDSVKPTVFKGVHQAPIENVPDHFLFENSFMAGYAAVMHALQSLGVAPQSDKRVAVLSAGAVSQGAWKALHTLGMSPRVFNRKTMQSFKDQMGDFDIIVNGIEIDCCGHIISSDDMPYLKALIIDAAADAGGAIEDSEYMTWSNPIKRVYDAHIYCVNNTPSLYHRTASEIISRVMSEHIYSVPCHRWKEMVAGFQFCRR